MKAVIVKIQGRRLKLEAGDEVWVEHHYCGRCDCDHIEITVSRNNKEIAKLGDEITLRDKDEIFGGVVVDEDGNILPDPHWIVHILANDMSCMTSDKLHYVGLCGSIVEGQDRMTFLRRTDNLSYLKKEEKKRLCLDCVRVYKTRYGKEV